MSAWLRIFPVTLLCICMDARPASHQQVIQDYIRVTYGEQLQLSPTEIDQLSWVMDNPGVTPEQAAITLPGDIHREIPRALSRIYNLQLLVRGGEEAYQLFISPQSNCDSPVLPYTAFNHLSLLTQQLGTDELAALKAAAIISAVTLSPEARENAAKAFQQALPEDSSRFLSLTATKAAEVYPLAQEVINRYPSAQHLFRIVFYPDSHLRHMMYNEGSLNMYKPLKQAIREKTIGSRELRLWYLYWVDNIAGFRGHISPEGSIYLTKNTYRAMDAVWQQLNKLLSNPAYKPMAGYLKQRAQWLGLDRLQGVYNEEKLALAALAASLRLFTPQQGRFLLQAFRHLKLKQQTDWVNYQRKQREPSENPTPTYAPAFFNNAITMSDLNTAITRLLPFYLAVVREEARLRSSGKLASKTPLSFFTVSQPSSIGEILTAPDIPAFTIDLHSGQVQLTER